MEQVPVYISWVRSIMDVQKYLIDDFLSKYGKVYSHNPVIEEEGVETFVHMFWMREMELRDNPPPNQYWIGKEKL